MTAHESCSRQHARIAFDAHGTPWLRDLGSGNGTFVNEKQLPPEACGKVYESTNSNRKGSRGVVLYPGDAIRFGASSRLYILEGPEEFDRGASNVHHHHHSETTPQPQQCSADATPPEQTEDSGCSWGMAADEIPPSDGEQQRSTRDIGDLPPLPSIDSFFFTSSEKYQIPSNLHQLHSQYNTRMHKIQSIQIECQRIMQKENMGVELTDGQRNQLGKNQERITTLEKDIATLKEKIEDGMFSVIHGKERGSKRPREDNQYDVEEDDVDCFYDRTAAPSKRRQKENGDAVESEASLIQKWKSLLTVRATQQQMAVRAMERCTGLQKLIDNADPDDLFFLENDLSLANEHLSKAKKSFEDTEKELDECEYLLKAVNDKLVWDRSDGLIGTNIAMKGESSLKDSNVTLSSTEMVARCDSMTMPPPPPAPTPTLLAGPSSVGDMPPPPPIAAPRRSSPVEDIDGTVKPPFGGKSSELHNATALQKKQKIVGPSRPPVQGTLAALKHSSAAPRTNAIALKPTESDVTLNMEKQKDEWKAPIDQDGSGRTALHDKFKGRY